MLEDMAEVVRLTKAPEVLAARDGLLAHSLTLEDVLLEASKWGGQVEEAKIVDYVRLVDKQPDKTGATLYSALRAAVPTEELKIIVDTEWSKLRPQQAAADQPPQYIYGDEDDLMNAMNEVCALARVGRSMLFVFKDDQGNLIFSPKRDAEIALAQYRLHVVTTKKDKDGKKIELEKEYSGLSVWLKSPLRREYKGVGFYPDPSKMPHGHLNLWTGLAVAPAAGDWSLLRAHLFDNVCRGNVEHFEYLMNWMSQLFYEPGVKSGIIVVLRGLPGTGKSKVGEWLLKIVGPRHSLVIDKSTHLIGHFNGHLEFKILINAEEALFAGNPSAGKTLKHIGTAEAFTYESKGVDAREGKNYCRVFMATNEEWAAPIDAGDRRYFVLDVGAARKEDKEYFAAIDDQMENGGAAAMLYELLERRMTFRKLGKPPMTAAKQEQIRFSMSPKLTWLASVLSDGQFSTADGFGSSETDWPVAGGSVLKATMLASYRAAVAGFRGPASPEEFAIFLNKHVPGLKSTKRADQPGGKRVPHYVLPPLQHARSHFVDNNPGYKFEESDDLSGVQSSMPANDPCTVRKISR